MQKGKSWLSWRLMVVFNKWKSCFSCSLSSSVQMKKASKVTNWALRLSFLSCNISQWNFFPWKVIGLGKLLNIFWPHLFVEREMKDDILALSQGPWESVGIGCTMLLWSWTLTKLENRRGQIRLVISLCTSTLMPVPRWRKDFHSVSQIVWEMDCIPWLSSIPPHFHLTTTCS